MRKNKFYAVIHVRYEEQVLRNVGIAFENGADGVFLINHRVSIKDLDRIYHMVRSVFPAKFIGINPLGMPVAQVVYFKKLFEYVPTSVSALWLDDVGYNENAGLNYRTYLADGIRFQFKNLCSKGAKLFGGLDFKYQTPVADIRKGASELSCFVDVLTTSGTKTGSPPDISKILLIRESVGHSKKIAVASGMTPENVDPFLDHVDYFLVATGISKNFHELDPIRVRMMSDKMRR